MVKNKKITSEKIIGFDLDGVIVDHSALKIRVAKECGFDLKLEETPSDIMKHLVPDSVADKIKYRIYGDPETSLFAPLMAGAKDAIVGLKEKNIKYFLISRRKNTALAAGLLKNHGLWPEYFNEQNAFFVSNIEGKNEKSKELGINCYIDDEPKVLESLESVEDKFLFDQFDIRDGVEKFERIGSWAELFKRLTAQA